MRNGKLLLGVFFGLMASGCSQDSSAPITWRYEYDGDRMNAVVNPAGERAEIDVERGSKEQVSRITTSLSDREVQSNFDELGRRVATSAGGVTTKYEYDPFNRLIAIRREGQPPILYLYDTANRVTDMRVGGGFALHYTYDFLGRIAQVDTPAGPIAYDYRYRDTLRVETRVLPNGIRTEYLYGAHDNLKSIAHTDKSGAALARYEYSYSPAGQIQTVREITSNAERTFTYGYDQERRLTSVNDSTGQSYSYTYDKIGGRTKAKGPKGEPILATYDWAGRLAEFNGNPCSHDAAGNLTSFTAKAGHVSLRYDERSQLAEVKSNACTVKYEYDDAGNLCRREDDDGASEFLCDPRSDFFHPVTSTDNEGKRTFYIWDGAAPLAKYVESGATYLLDDFLGSPRVVVDSSGKVIRRQDYDPYGVPGKRDSDVALTPAFTGLFYDNHAGFYITRARTYAPELGRFFQHDPIQRIPGGSHQDLSPYTYCGNDPINFVDLTGGEARVRGWVRRVGTGIENFARPYAEYWADRNVNSDSAVERRLAVPLGVLAASFTDMEGVTAWAKLVPQVRAAELALDATTVLDRQSTESEFNDAAKSVLFDRIIKQARTIGALARLNFGRDNTFSQLALANRRIATAGEKLVEGTEVASGIANTIFGTPETSSGPSPPAITMPQPGVTRGDELLLNEVRESSGLYDTPPSPLSDGDLTGTGGTQTIVFDENAPEGGLPPLDPQPVGGVYLGGAAKVLPELGELSGIAIGENNQLVLLARQQSTLPLPPVRLDDVVTVFRCVYLHGEAPWVTIDPDPKRPHANFHTVRHDEGSANTYVGWVLFECDRVMKTYSSGQDNVTKKPIRSRIPNYQTHLEVRFKHYDAEEAGPTKLDRWTRKWLLPAAVDRRQTATRDVTLLDVPIKVNTESQILRNGKFENAPRTLESDKEFAAWFSDHYDEIAAEVYLEPPAESGMRSSVPVFAELKRIALISAVAESLRDQGVPFPFWMRDYPVRPCPVPKTTPAIETALRRDIGDSKITLSVFGGAKMAPTDDVVQIVAAAPEAEALAPKVKQAIATAQVLKPVKFEQDGKPVTAVAMPGPQTRDVSACVLAETDLLVPVSRGIQIGVVRKYSSFISPKDTFGGAWTLDLPRLEELWRPTKRVGDKTLRTDYYHLTSPLNTYSEIFDEIKNIPELTYKVRVPKSSRLILGSSPASDDDEKLLGIKARELLFRDGTEWFFDEAGNLAGVRKTPVDILYRRDAKTHRIAWIEGRYGKELKASIAFEYDAQGRVVAAINKRKIGDERVTYTYNANGQLSRVEGPRGVYEYQYGNGLVTQVRRDGKSVAKFTYGDRGQLTSQEGTTRSTSYSTKTNSDGVEISALTRDEKGVITTDDQISYDASFRPLKRVRANGTTSQWKYGEGQELEQTVSLPQGQEFSFRRSADGKRADVVLPSGGAYQAELDGAGRVARLSQAGRQFVSREWYKDGSLSSVTYETVALHPKYGDDDVLNEVLVAPPGKGPFKTWFTVTLDAAGGPQKLADSAGLDVVIERDQRGAIAKVIANGATTTIARDNQGRIKSVDDSNGRQERLTYGEDDNIERVDFAEGTQQASVTFADGRPQQLSDFVGGQYKFKYYSAGEDHSGKIKEVRTPSDLILSYEYDSEHHLSAVDCAGFYRLEYIYNSDGRLTSRSMKPSPRSGGTTDLVPR